MGNLHQDMVVDQIADLVIHAGDHGYNEGDVDEHRGDGCAALCASVCAARTLNATGESRVTLSLRQERLRAALSHGRRKGA